MDFPLHACWMKRGQQTRLPISTPARQCVHWVGAYNWGQNTIDTLRVPRKTSQTFIHFLDHLLLNCYPTRPVVLVMDNASYHRSADVQAALSLFEERVMVCWLPPYSPDLNPIERFWLFLKQEACVNRLFNDLSHLIDVVQALFQAQNDPVSRRFALSDNFH